MPTTPPSLVNLLASINKLQLKAFNAVSRENLAFIILNDTYQVIPYDRALLWDFAEHPPQLLGISGQHKTYKETEISQKWSRLISHLNNPEEAKTLSKESFSSENHIWDELYPNSKSIVYWIPIKIDDRLRLGFWVEQWEPSVQHNPAEVLEFLSRNLIPAYASAWAKFDQRDFIKPLIKKHKLKSYAFLTLLALLFAIRIPLRIAAPCEIVTDRSIMVTAPLDGIIAQVFAKPGQQVTPGTLLFEYDKRIPLEEVKEAEKQLDISQAELDRANTLGMSDPKSLSELDILRLKLEKQRITFQFAESQAKQLDVKAPEKGIVMIDDPDDWRGKPVKIGMKILTINDPDKTKLKIWIPESDNIIIDQSKPLKVFLNVQPEREFKATLNFISFESSIGEDQVPSFLAEASFEKPPEKVKLGQKGTAILYGENVSLFYYLIRKPWSTFRNITGI